MLRHKLNPCDIDRYPVLAPLGDMLAASFKLLTYGTDCPCCLAVRVALLAAASFTLGAVLL